MPGHKNSLYIVLFAALASCAAFVPSASVQKHLELKALMAATAPAVATSPARRRRKEHPACISSARDRCVTTSPFKQIPA
jgi:hypothetical protein